jgi:hypothetical protein
VARRRPDQHVRRRLLGQHSLQREIPVLVVVFGVPAAAAWFVARRFGSGTVA